MELLTPHTLQDNCLGRRQVAACHWSCQEVQLNFTARFCDGAIHGGASIRSVSGFKAGLGVRVQGAARAGLVSSLREKKQSFEDEGRDPGRQALDRCRAVSGGSFGRSLGRRRGKPQKASKIISEQFVQSQGEDESDDDDHGAQDKDETRSDSSSDDTIAELSPSTVRFGPGLVPAVVLFVLLTGTLTLVDAYIWRVIRRPLASFFLTLPFLLSTAITGYLGVVSVPILRRLKAGQIVRTDGPQGHLAKAGTPTMGGLFFIPVGLLVARFATGYPAPELRGPLLATLALGGIGLLDDCLILTRNHNDGLPGPIKLLLQALVGLWFYMWLDSAALPSPYKYKLLVCLPPPLVWLVGGPLYLPLTVFTFAAMSNGVNLTDGLDGLAAGTCAAAFIGMALATIAVYPSLGIFGASMAGACIGFLAHNRHKAAVFMGDTGSLALGGALASMAATTGMFFPLVIASAVFIIETLSVIGQVAFFKATRRLYGSGRRLFKMAPFHHHLEQLGFSEPAIVTFAYLAALAAAALAAYVGLVSA